MPWYLGRTGAGFVALPPPSRGTQVPFGGGGATHQLLSGGQVVDKFPPKRSWQFSWQALTRDQVGVLDAFVYGANGSGPFVLFDPEQRNLLSPVISSPGNVDGSILGFTAGAHSNVFPATAGNLLSVGGPFPPVGLNDLGVAVFTGMTTSEPIVNTPTSTPVLPSTPYAASVYISNNTSIGMALQIKWLNAAGTWFASNTGSTVAAGATARSVVLATSPGTAAIAGLAILSTASYTGTTQFADVGGLQFEQASAASAWVLGLGVPTVSVAPGGGRGRQQTNQNDYSLTLVEL